MLANRDMAVEAAKKMVSMQFNLADGLSGMDIGNAGYLYETDSSNEFENNLVEIEGTYAGAGKESGTVYLWCDYSGGMVWRAEIHTEKRNEESWEMGDSSVRRTDSILCVPNGKVFSGRCSDELLLWKRGIPGVGDN